ncbi:TPA: hypothetical protein MW242_002627 [Acinetobacter baumannii]|nr:hypothetical protein [Acinetobacter baumannii]
MKKTKLVSNTPKLWWPFILIAGIGNVWMFINLNAGRIQKDDLLLLQIPLMSAFVIGLIGLLKVNTNMYEERLNPDQLGYQQFELRWFLKWYIPLILISLALVCVSNLLWRF